MKDCQLKCHFGLSIYIHKRTTWVGASIAFSFYMFFNPVQKEEMKGWRDAKVSIIEMLRNLPNLQDVDFSDFKNLEFLLLQYSFYQIQKSKGKRKRLRHV